MAVSPDDRFANLITSSAERGGWVPEDVHVLDADGDVEPVAPRRIRLPVLVSLVLVTLTVLIAGFVLLRPAPRTAPDAAGTGEGTVAQARSTDASVSSSEPSHPAKSAMPAVVVHVTGQVKDPSVVTLPAGSRVEDAVQAAGGLTAAADGEAVNLARLLVDGEQIHIPAPGEDPKPGPADARDREETTGPAGGEETDSAKIDLNTADATILQTLPGIGPVTAEAIIAHREATPFVSIEDLLLVNGIGPKTFEKLKDSVTVG